VWQHRPNGPMQVARRFLGRNWGGSRLHASGRSVSAVRGQPPRPHHQGVAHSPRRDLGAPNEGASGDVLIVPALAGLADYARLEHARHGSIDGFQPRTRAMSLKSVAPSGGPGPKSGTASSPPTARTALMALVKPGLSSVPASLAAQIRMAGSQAAARVQPLAQPWQNITRDASAMSPATGMKQPCSRPPDNDNRRRRHPLGVHDTGKVLLILLPTKPCARGCTLRICPREFSPAPPSPPLHTPGPRPS
jgi:hypothetical protein